MYLGLPIKYLGLPLTTKTMSRGDYEPLLAKIRARFLSWTSKALAFPGRLQMINSVIASMTNFWCSAFSLPQGCIDEIESMCSAFLWSESPNITSKAKVAWGEVCKTKEEGGLGVRRISDVSVVFDLKLVWRLFTSSDSLWVKWMKQTILRGESFWDAKAGAVGSWIWKKLLQLRPLAKQFLRIEVQSGNSVGFWTDLWHPMGRLIELTSLVHAKGIMANVDVYRVLDELTNLDAACVDDLDWDDLFDNQDRDACRIRWNQNGASYRQAAYRLTWNPTSRDFVSKVFPRHSYLRESKFGYL
ncbi:hypothetical protein Bca101_097738 [Brassica carinata]